MAEEIVDVLEAVEIDAEHRRHVAAPADRRDRLLETLAEQLAVGQRGQRVMQGQILRAPLGLDLGGDVGRGAAPAAVAPPLVADRLARDPERA